MAKKIINFIDAFNVRNATVLLIILLAGDLIFILLTFLNLFLHINDPIFQIWKERSYAEYFQYIKYFTISVLLIYISIKNSSFYFLAWVMVFVYLLIDDVYRIHERYGFLIAKKLDFVPPFDLTLQEFGELSVTLIASVILAFFLLPAYKYGSREFRKVTCDLLIFLLLLFFFGVFLDIAHVAYHFKFSIKFILIVIEDGGEMITASLILWYVYLLAVRGIKADYYICDIFR